MSEAVGDIKKNNKVRSVILCSLVPGIFCAGKSWCRFPFVHLSNKWMNEWMQGLTILCSARVGHIILFYFFVRVFVFALKYTSHFKKLLWLFCSINWIQFIYYIAIYKVRLDQNIQSLSCHSSCNKTQSVSKSLEPDMRMLCPVCRSRP